MGGTPQRSMHNRLVGCSLFQQKKGVRTLNTACCRRYPKRTRGFLSSLQDAFCPPVKRQNHFISSGSGLSWATWVKAEPLPATPARGLGAPLLPSGSRLWLYKVALPRATLVIPACGADLCTEPSAGYGIVRNKKCGFQPLRWRGVCHAAKRSEAQPHCVPLTPRSHCLPKQVSAVSWALFNPHLKNAD